VKFQTDKINQAISDFREILSATASGHMNQVSEAFLGISFINAMNIVPYEPSKRRVLTEESSSQIVKSTAKQVVKMIKKAELLWMSKMCQHPGSESAKEVFTSEAETMAMDTPSFILSSFNFCLSIETQIQNENNGWIMKNAHHLLTSLSQTQSLEPFLPKFDLRLLTALEAPPAKVENRRSFHIYPQKPKRNIKPTGVHYYKGLLYVAEWGTYLLYVFLL
jgi:hypothetical protein